MSKSSTVTVREKPVEDVAWRRLAALRFTVRHSLCRRTSGSSSSISPIGSWSHVRHFNIREGLVTLWSMHTTCALFINEFQTALLSDIRRFLEQMVARDAEWMHNDPSTRTAIA